MNDLFRILYRLSALGLILLCIAAVGVGRLIPTSASHRRVPELSLISIHNEVCSINDRDSRFLDPDHHAIVRLRLPRGEALDRASVSPWRDANGEGQVVGRWMSFTGRLGDLASRGSGLGRYTFPGGEPIDRIETDILPLSPPCWVPGTAAQVLFAAADGRLYRLDFETATGQPAHADQAGPQPERLAWRVEGLPEEQIILGDPVWPSDPRFQRTILVSLHRKDGVGRAATRFLPAELWWLRLDESGRTILAAGAIDTSEADRTSADQERFPTVAVDQDGRCLLGYLRMPAFGRSSTLMVAPLQFAGDSGRPVLAAPPQALAERCVPNPFAFSSDARSLTCVATTLAGGAAPGMRVVHLLPRVESLLASRAVERPAVVPGS